MFYLKNEPHLNENKKNKLIKVKGVSPSLKLMHELKD